MKRVFLLVSALLAGCSSAPEPTSSMYLLPKVESQTLSSAAVAERPLLIVRPVELASYLNNSGIVYRTSESQIIQAKHNQWAQSISEQITQRIIDDLRHKQSHYWPVQVHSLIDQSSENKLQLSLSRFNGNYQGNAELEGEWMLIDANGKVRHRSPVKILMPLQDEGYDALVGALSAGLENLTDNIAQQL
ncbi:ABC-type transport auxiliary lipoprotein family protein [Vibrio natriegens]|uniref:PqiC family protein n=1 Tax=Vibrio natriegens TaxID=691 RepID=UPI001EFC6692|nr:ABC-type transport auxiliary lipoprotein family protein [Vibrio natriegens]MCG9699268.1 ABC-type transport auxiliary lipoprotein family protein [Vibrio natriegens]